MRKYQKGADTAVLVLHEIYGINKHIETICQSLSLLNLDVFVPNLLGVRPAFSLDQEETAYQFFMDEIGFAGAYQQASRVLREIRNQYRRIIVIGFSTGATIAWLCSQDAGLCDAVVGFYGSRIRDYTKIQPTCQVLLLFAENEPAFLLTELLVHLANRPLVTIKLFPGEHGFTNPASIHYNQQSSQQAFDEMHVFINQIIAAE